MNAIIKKNGITYGIISGIFSALITASVYAIDLNLFTSWWLGVLLFSVYIIIGIILLSKTKKELGGVFTFKEAFTTYFICAVVGILISVAFNILLFNVIDPSAKDSLHEIVIKYTKNFMEKLGTPASAINEAIKKMQENNPYSAIELLKGSIFSILGSAIFGLIMAAFFKSKSTSQE